MLAANALATALVPLLVPGHNFVRAMFLDPVARELYDDIEERQAGAAASLRAFAGPDVDDPQFIELVGELSIKSPDFRRLWSRHDVRPTHGALPRIGIRHPQLGPIDLDHTSTESRRASLIEDRHDDTKSARPPGASRFVPIARPSSRLGPKVRAYSVARVTLNYVPSGG